MWHKDKAGAGPLKVATEAGATAAGRQLDTFGQNFWLLSMSSFSQLGTKGTNKGACQLELSSTPTVSQFNQPCLSMGRRGERATAANDVVKWLRL